MNGVAPKSIVKHHRSMDFGVSVSPLSE